MTFWTQVVVVKMEKGRWIYIFRRSNRRIRSRGQVIQMPIQVLLQISGITLLKSLPGASASPLSHRGSPQASSKKWQTSENHRIKESSRDLPVLTLWFNNFVILILFSSLPQMPKTLLEIHLLEWYPSL